MKHRAVIELISLGLSKNVFEELPRRQAFCVVGVKETWRTLSVSEGQRPESHTKTLMERASSRNQMHSFFAPKKVRNYHSYEEGFFQSLRFVKASKLERGVMEVLQLCCIKQN